MVRLSIRLLGPFQASLEGEPTTGFKYDHVRALLAYLAVETDRPHRRERLAGLLWPDQPHSRALSNLRYALYNLRNALRDRRAHPPGLTVTRQTLQFNTASDHWLDVRAFEQHLADSRSAEVPLFPPRSEASLDGAPVETAAFHHLQSAVQLYRGAFMEGFSLANSPAFEEWLLLRQEQLAQQVLSALHRLIQIHAAEGAYDRAEPCARRLLDLEPWDEEAHRQLMRVLALSGRRSAALAHYRTCRRTLAEELGVEPTDQTTALYRQIRDGTLSRRLQPVSAPPTLSQPVPVVARERQLKTLDRFLRQALAGRGRVAFITGDAGSGKTTLMEAFARHAMAVHQDLIVADGRCNAHAGIGDPYLPFREMLNMLTGDVEARRASGTLTAEHTHRLWDLFPDAVQALVSQGPDLVGRFLPEDALALRAEAFAHGDPGWRTRLHELMRRRRAQAPLSESTQADLFEQVTRVFQVLARRRPLLLMLDDLQWADTGTVSLLFHLARRLKGHRILLLGAYRPADLLPRRDGERHPLKLVLHELQRDVGDMEVDLNRADGRRFVDALLDSEPNRLGATFRETLYRHTDGNPLFTVELLRGLQEQGGLLQDEAGRWVAEPSLAWRRLPERVEGVIAEHIGRMPRACRETLTVASVEGETFTAEVVAQVQGVDEGQVIRRLSGPLSKQHRLVKGDTVRHLEDRRLSRYRFRHVLFRAYLYRNLDDVERSRLHEAVGRALERLHGERTDEISGRLARHFEAAGMMTEAVDYLLQAGQRAVRLAANEEAVALFDHALELLASLPASPQRDRREFILRSALYAPLTATRGYACPQVASSNARAHELGLRLGEERELIPALISLAGLHSFRAEFQRATALAKRALMLAEQDGAPGHVVWAAQVLGMTAMYQGHLLAARRYLERTLAFDRTHHEAMVPVRGRHPEVVYRSFGAWVLWFLGYPDQAAHLGRKALQLAEDVDHPPSLAMALQVGNIIPRLLRREYALVPELVESLEDITAVHRLGLSEPGIRLARGRAMVRDGASRAGIREMRQGLAAWRATGTKAWASLYLGVLADAYLEAGQLEQARHALEDAFQAVQESDERMIEPELHRLWGELLLRQDGEEESEASFRQAIDLARRQQARSWELRAAISLCRLWHRQGRTEEARDRLSRIYDWFEEGFDTPDLKEARTLLASMRSPRPSSGN